MTFAAFVISTGRCGTQWLAASLDQVYADLITVEHEPLHNQYEPRSTAARRITTDGVTGLPQAVIAHCEAIEKRLDTRSYLECGHPCWSTIPYLVRRFQGRVRIIHLTRHPVKTCYSWLTHGAFQEPILPHIPPKTLLSPFDEGTLFAEYQEGWEGLSPFEKCLYFWCEVNAFALDLRSRLNVPWLQLRYEDLFEADGNRGRDGNHDSGGPGLGQLLEFLELPQREGIVRQKAEVIDQFHYLSPVRPDWRIIERHPRALAISRDLGYAVNQIDDVEMDRRYFGPGGFNSRNSPES